MSPGTKTPGQLSKHTLDFYLSQQQADGGKQKWWRSHGKKSNKGNKKLF